MNNLEAQAATSGKWGVIYSARAGNKSAHKKWKLICDYLKEKNVAFDYLESEGYGGVERLSRIFASNGYETIVVVGGDGSLSDAVNGIMNTPERNPDVALAVIPNGISNDFARFWAMDAEDYKKSVDIILQRRKRKIDVGVFDFIGDGNVERRYFLNCVNIGLGARLIAKTDEFNRLSGSKRYSALGMALSQTFERKSFKVRLKADTEIISSDVMSVCIGNSLGYGQTPNAVPYNGYLDISVVTRPQWWQMFEGFWLLEKGHFLNYKNVKPYRVSEVEILEAEKAPISVDDKILKNKEMTNMKVSLIREGIDFIFG